MLSASATTKSTVGHSLRKFFDAPSAVAHTASSTPDAISITHSMATPDRHGTAPVCRTATVSLNRSARRDIRHMHAPEPKRDDLYVDAVYDMIVISNRLPVDYQPGPDGETHWKSSPGGLVTALEPVMRAADGAWIGWAGVADREFDPFENDGISIIPVPLSAQELEDYYEGFSNDTIWPLYHDVIAPPTFHREWWDAYVRVNRRFAEAAARAASDGAVVWVQDYQLQLVPKMLREIRPDLVIGFFN